MNIDPIGSGERDPEIDKESVWIRRSFVHYGGALLAVIFTTFIGKLLAPYFDLINIAILYLLPVLVAAVRWGRRPSFFAAGLSVFAFDFFFVPPVFSLSVHDMRHFFIFAMFLIVAIVTGTMATRLRTELAKTQERELRTLALYDLSRKIAAESDLQRVLQMVVQKVAESVSGEVVMLVRSVDTDALLEVAAYPAHDRLFDDKEQAVTRWVMGHGEKAGKGTEVLSAAEWLFFPVKAEDKTLAALAVKTKPAERALTSEQLQLIEAFSNLAAVAIIRVNLAHEAEQAKWLSESEKLHAALLNSISHDLRTPLAAITGAVTSLICKETAYNANTEKTLLHTINQGAQRLNRLVGNLLDMVRLESGILKLNTQWCDVEDVVGVALREMKDMLQPHPLDVKIPQGLPLVKADFGLVEHVLMNLLENAVKYSPEGGTISVAARYAEGLLYVSIADRGPTIPHPERERVFDKFYRLNSAKKTSGTGMGLSICKGIVEAHGGKIWVDPSYDTGTQFVFFLPVPEQPGPLSDTREEVSHAL
ncbi:MAG TPA: ATP-binding protein [Syntrophorhabdaceae bacterium]|nr:ATP-binding protein [Syntrophorhabdaceae bacterium]